MRVQFYLKAKTPEELSFLQLKNDVRKGESFNYTTPIVFKGQLVSFYWMEIHGLDKAVRVIDKLEQNK